MEGLADSASRQWGTVRRYCETKRQALSQLLEVSHVLQESVEEADPSEIQAFLDRREELIRLIDAMDHEMGKMPIPDLRPGRPLTTELRDKISSAFGPLRTMLLQIKDMDRRSSSALMARRDRVGSRLKEIRQRVRVSHSYSKSVCPQAKFLDVKE